MQSSADILPPLKSAFSGRKPITWCHISSFAQPLLDAMSWPYASRVRAISSNGFDPFAMFALQTARARSSSR